MFTNMPSCPTCHRSLLSLYGVFDSKNNVLEYLFETNSKTGEKTPLFLDNIKVIKKYKLKPCCVVILATSNDYDQKMPRKI